jgi:hypothetical protein
MKYMILTLTLLLAFSGTGLEGTTLTRRAEVFELIAKDGSLIARVFVGTDSLLLDFPIQQRGYLFKPESYVYLNRSDKTYSVHSYANLLASLPNKANSESFNRQNASSDVWVAGFRQTGETDLIAGFNATKIVSTSRDKGEIEIWVSEEITPPALRAVGREIRNILPINYWDDDNRLPTLFQAILVYGVPLRIVDHEIEGSDVEAVAMKKEDIPDSLFKISSEYREKQDISQ